MSAHSPEDHNPTARLKAIEEALVNLAQYQLPQQPQSVIEDVIRQLHLLAEEISITQAGAQAAREENAKFVSVLTHELRIPLTAIKGYADLLRQGMAGSLGEQQKTFLNVIRTNTDRMSALISDLADISYIQTGRLQPRRQEVHPDRLVGEILQSWQQQLQEKSLKLTIKIEPDLPRIELDPERFKQVTNYLLNNSILYTPENGRIEVTCSMDGNSLKMEVQDSGIGIRDEDQTRLFTPFFRSENSVVREIPGWGLSLHVAKLLIELMGGKIGVASQPEMGSTFWFTLPVK